MMAFTVGVLGVECAAGERQDVHLFRRGCYWQWTFGGLGSGTRIQFSGNWLKDKLFGSSPCVFSTALLSQQGKNLFFSPPWPIDNT